MIDKPVEQSEWTQWFKIEKLNAVDMNYIQNDNILAGVCCPFIISYNFSKIIERYSGNVVKPDCISNYNQHMEGVDKRDQLL